MYIESAVSQHHRLFSTLNSAGSLLGRLNFFPCVRRVRGVRPVAYLLLLLLLNLLVRKRPRAFRCNIFPFLRDLLCDGCVCRSLCLSVCVCVCAYCFRSSDLLDALQTNGFHFVTVCIYWLYKIIISCSLHTVHVPWCPYNAI